MTLDDNLPELGTKAAAVESCASLIFYAVNGDKPVQSEQLRYWLDLYYQVRFAYECERQEERIGGVYTGECKKARIATAPPAPRNDSIDGDRCAELDEGLRELLREQACNLGIVPEPARAVGDAGPYKVEKIPEEQLREVAALHDHLNDVIKKASAAAGIEIEEGDGADEGSPSTVSAPP